MKKFKVTTVISIALFLQLPFIQSVYSQSHYPVEVQYQPVQVRISNLKIISDVENNQANKVLSGTVKRRSYNSHVLQGHIDYVVLNKANGIIHEGAINVPGLNLRNNRYGRQFKILLPATLPEGSHIKIGWHKTQASVLSNSSIYHKQNSLL
jgi:hypothetical protein